MVYRIEVEGEVGPDWAAWFDAEVSAAGSGRTSITAAVADQAQLQGLLRRIHDLHLRLVSVTRRHDDLQLPSHEE